MIGPDDAIIPCLFMNITLAAWALSDHFFVVLLSGLTDGVFSTRAGLGLLGAFWKGFVSIYLYPWGLNEYLYKGTILLLRCNFIFVSLYISLSKISTTLKLLSEKQHGYFQIPLLD
jgi:hypothetical protein